jgi:hypothetical protein
MRYRFEFWRGLAYRSDYRQAQVIRIAVFGFPRNAHQVFGDFFRLAAMATAALETGAAVGRAQAPASLKHRPCVPVQEYPNGHQTPRASDMVVQNE